MLNKISRRMYVLKNLYKAIFAREEVNIELVTFWSCNNRLGDVDMAEGSILDIFHQGLVTMGHGY